MELNRERLLLPPNTAVEPAIYFPVAVIRADIEYALRYLE